MTPIQNRSTDARPTQADIFVATLAQIATYLAIALGTIFGLALTAASQLWGYPVPRALFLDLAGHSQTLAVQATAVAIGLTILDRFQTHRFWGPSVQTLMFAAYTALVGFSIYWNWSHVSGVLGSLDGLQKCQREIFAKVCSAGIGELDPLQVFSTVRRLQGWLQ